MSRAAGYREHRPGLGVGVLFFFSFSFKFIYSSLIQYIPITASPQGLEKLCELETEVSGEVHRRETSGELKR